jgi:antitoxin HigA-1
MTTMKHPPHPGLSVRHDCIEPLDLTITAAAEILGVRRQTLNNLVNGKSGISADMAIRLDKAFGGGAETWQRLQMAYDLAQARQHEGNINVEPVTRRRAVRTVAAAPALLPRRRKLARASVRVM